MKPTSEDFEPRRDGWFEHSGTWGEVVVGTVLAVEKRSQRWEVIDVSHGHQVEYGHTLWMRVREQTTGEEHTISPRVKTLPVRILTQNPGDVSTGTPTAPSDAESIALLIEKLGATALASRDERTGEITCPYYAAGHNHLNEVGNGSLQRGEVEHLRFAHGVEVDDDISLVDMSNLHASLHDLRTQQGGGFPHRHVPEDLTFL